jgi:NAD(P)H-hydrate epimerase
MFPAAPASVPSVTAAQMREVDRLMVEAYGITMLQMMEHAGRAVARVARAHFFGGDVRGRRVVVLAGTGGNGGGGLVAARHLSNAGAVVQVWTTRPDAAYDGVPAHQLGILRAMAVEVHPDGDPPGRADLVVDALLGYSLDGPPRGRAAERIRWANGQPTPTLSLDLPSGLDATTGEVLDPCVRAAATVTLALPKTGLATARDAAGALYLADIGVPPALYARLGLPTAPLFHAGDLLTL